MNKRLRSIPYPIGSERRQQYIANSLRYGWASNYREAVAQVVAANMRARNTPRHGERCGARTRRGTSCQCKALRNGRCKYHGGVAAWRRFNITHRLEVTGALSESTKEMQ